MTYFHSSGDSWDAVVDPFEAELHAGQGYRYTTSDKGYFVESVETSFGPDGQS